MWIAETFPFNDIQAFTNIGSGELRMIELSATSDYIGIYYKTGIMSQILKNELNIKLLWYMMQKNMQLKFDKIIRSENGTITLKVEDLF